MARRRRAQRTNSSRRPSAAGRQAQRSFRLERLEERQLLTASGYEQVNLVSDQAGSALIVDPNLVNPYGIAMAPGSGDAWVANAGSDTISRYIGAVAGSPFKVDSPAIANMPGSLTGPTGIVSNSTGDFIVQTPGGGTGSASFIFSSENGQLAVAPTLDTDTATAGNNPASGAFYTGLAQVTVNSNNYLYAANFAAGTISVFDNHFQLSAPLVSGAFQDPNLPTGYSPYNIQVLSVGGTPLVFVTYAEQDTNDATKVAAGSQGLIDVYSLDGTFQTELVTTVNDPQISAPWGMAIAPASFGDFANDLLVANGDGTIHTYSLTTNASAAPTAAYTGTLSDSSGTPITITGLHGLAFGNNTSVGNASTLFFSAGGSDGTHGLFGELINAFDNPLTAQGTSFTATEATSFNGVVAAFTPEAARAGDTFTATIDWGDGSSSSTGTLTSNGSGGFLVSGTHTYDAAGEIASIAVSIVDTTSVGATASLSSTALVIEGNLSATSTAVAATEGTALSNVPVIVFTDPFCGRHQGLVHGHDRLGRRHDHLCRKHQRVGRHVHRQRFAHVRPARDRDVHRFHLRRRRHAHADHRYRNSDRRRRRHVERHRLADFNDRRLDLFRQRRHLYRHVHGHSGGELHRHDRLGRWHEHIHRSDHRVQRHVHYFGFARLRDPGVADV